MKAFLKGAAVAVGSSAMSVVWFVAWEIGSGRVPFADFSVPF